VKHTKDSTLNKKETEMLPEYEFDYKKAKPNRFVEKATVTVIIEPDVAEYFSNSEAVNHALRSLISAIPKSFIHK
jgi:hypothetical protein